ncbi:MAG TPA: GNAT family N-acetyltransferase [Gaiellales bacterium]|nr:GNAT family N-acetyltransferase [Gaiellales bacterium]
MPSRGPAYRIVTPRLVVRCWDPRDAPLAKEAIDSSLDHLRPWMPWARNEPQTLAQKVELLREFRGQFDLGSNSVYAIFDRREERVLGGTGLHPRVGPGALEIGYWIRADAVRQGFATESSAALTRVAFEIASTGRVEIHCASDNHASAAIPLKLGYAEQERDGDDRVFALTAEAFPGTPAAGSPLAAYDVIGAALIDELGEGTGGRDGRSDDA